MKFAPGRHRRWRTAAGVLVLLVWLPAIAASAALPLTLEDGGLAPREREAAQALVEQAQALFPAEVVPMLPALTLQFSELPPRVHGRLRGGRIRVARHLLQTDAARPQALAALLHELGHALDRELGLSRDPRLRDLAGWQLRPRRFGARNRTNPMRSRSPDLYELSSPREFFAVNLEHFLLDADYACRRPALHRHFSAVLGSGGASEQSACAAALPFIVPASDPALEMLDPARVQAVEYLLAEPAGGLSSRWGHAMLRLVVCAPQRPPGTDCRLDLEHHRVLSFRAFVDDVQVSAWQGLSGGYPSRLFVLPLNQVLDEYTRAELRGLRSVPLQLAHEEIASLLERAAQLHWSYEGRYTFLGNNCASEVFKLLREGVPRLADARFAAISPTALLRRLERAGIARPVALDESQALALGYRFAAADAHLTQMFRIARDHMSLPADDPDTWLTMTPAQRQPWLQQGDLRASAALLVLEETAMWQLERRAREQLRRRLQRLDTPQRAQLDEAIRLEALLAHPAGLLRDAPGYGLPLAAERAHAARQAGDLARDWRQRSEQLYESASRLLAPELRQALQQVRGNVDSLGHRLRQLAQVPDDGK